MATSFLSASWYRVAELRPQLRRHAQVQRQRFRGRPWYVLLDPASGKVHRFTPVTKLKPLRIESEAIECPRHPMSVLSGLVSSLQALVLDRVSFDPFLDPEACSGARKVSFGVSVC